MASVVGSAFSPASGSSSLGSIRDEVARYVKMPNAAQGLQVAQQHIKSAIDRLNTRPWFFLLEVHDFTTAATRDYTVPTGLSKPRALHALDSSDNPNHSIPYLDPKTFDLEHPITGEARNPAAYTVYSRRDTGNLTLTHVPDSQFISEFPKLRFRYYKFLAMPSSLGNEIDVDGPAELFIKFYAKWLMALDFMPQKAVIARQEADTIWQDLIKLDRDNTDWD